MTTANWDDPRTKILGEIIATEVAESGTAENGFKKVQWTRIMAKFKLLTGESYSKQQLQSKLQAIKKKWVVFAALMDNSGFGFDPDLNIPTAPDAIWAEYLAAHPKQKSLELKHYHFTVYLMKFFQEMLQLAHLLLVAILRRFQQLQLPVKRLSMLFLKLLIIVKMCPRL